MFVVHFEYEIVGEGFVESCEGFNKLNEARDFGHNVIDEICDNLEEGIEIDDVAVHIWYDGDGEITEDFGKED